MKNIIYCDNRICVCIKPQGVLSTNESGGMPSLLREELGDSKACVRSVHRLDRVVGGVMVYARSAVASQILSQQIREHKFTKNYLAIIHGVPKKSAGIFEDLLFRNKEERKTYVVTAPGKDVLTAKLSYRVLDTTNGLSLVKIHLETGRTHQIRCQFSSHKLPLVGDKKYGIEDGAENIALWSCTLGFIHPQTGEKMQFTALPPVEYPWNLFDISEETTK